MSIFGLTLFERSTLKIDHYQRNEFSYHNEKTTSTPIEEVAEGQRKFERTYKIKEVYVCSLRMV